MSYGSRTWSVTRSMLWLANDKHWCWQTGSLVIRTSYINMMVWLALNSHEITKDLQNWASGC